MSTDEELRERCLEMAIRTTSILGYSNGGITEVAERYFNYIKGNLSPENKQKEAA